MSALLDTLIVSPIVIGGYAYVGYPALLKAVARLRPAHRTPREPEEWPLITITVPCYNEARNLASTLDALLALDYPADRRQIVVISDASTDATDDIARSYCERGIELLRLPERRGKSAAENAAAAVARGEIVVNTDATIRVQPDALKRLVAVFEDPSVGCASGRDVSITGAGAQAVSGESGYVGYEMAIRALETRVGSIVGASGCFYGIRRSLYEEAFPEALSRDFAAVLVTREAGYRTVSVHEAVCLVPRTSSLQSEFRRKIRTMLHGLQTLWYKRALLNPVRYGAFAWMLASHKLCRWLVYPALPVAAVALVVASLHSTAWRLVLGLAVVGTALGIIGMRWPQHRRAPALITLAGFALASNLAGLLAWWAALRDQRAATWEPTRR